MMDAMNLMIVGVGGQGTLLSSKLIGHVFVSAGYDVKVSEVHGMSQRGGSVVTYVRCGRQVSSPIIETGEADCILAFEELEAARYLPYLKKGGLMVVGQQCIPPMPVITGKAAYPQGLLHKLEGQDMRLVGFDALSLAEQAGSVKAVNVVLIGRLAREMDFGRDVWEEAVEATVPQRFLELNRRAFALGYEGK